MVVTWDIIYQTSKEVMTSIINKNSLLMLLHFLKIEQLITYFSCLKNDWIETSRDEQKKFIKLFPIKIQKLTKLKII